MARSFATFLINNQLFGVEILLVREINRQLDLSPVPQSADYIRGLINLRGQIVTIMDLKKRLGLGEASLSSETHNVILKTDTEMAPIRARENREDLVTVIDSVGLLVDAVRDVVTVADNEVDPPPANMGAIDGKYLEGVIKLDGELVAVLNTSKVLEHSLN